MAHTFCIAEAGVNHNGDSGMALELVDIAARCGADAVKFQTFSAERLVRRGAATAEYQKRQTGIDDQFEMLKKLEMSEALHHALFERCAELNIEFMSTPFDTDAVDFLLSLGMKRIKVPSGEITNHPFIEYLSSKNVPLILSTGMANMVEVQEAVEVVRRTREANGFAEATSAMLTVLHCTSNYPAHPNNVNLRAMAAMRAATSVPVGYSDHTAGIAIVSAAVALGATVIEKHFTLDRSLPGPDHQASLEPDELATLIRHVREVEQALGSDEKSPAPTELPVRSLVRRSVTLNKSVKCGHPLVAADLVLLRPGDGIQPKDISKVIGRIVRTTLDAGHTLQWSDLE